MGPIRVDIPIAPFVEVRTRTLNAPTPSAITALVATRELAKHPGAMIIHHLITSAAVPEIVAEHGGHPVRSRVGHSFIKAEMARTGGGG